MVLGKIAQERFNRKMRVIFCDVRSSLHHTG